MKQQMTRQVEQRRKILIPYKRVIRQIYSDGLDLQFPHLEQERAASHGDAKKENRIDEVIHKNECC